MTYRDRLKADHPNCVDDAECGGCRGCPKDYGYEDQQFCTNGFSVSCYECWSREAADNAERPYDTSR